MSIPVFVPVCLDCKHIYDDVINGIKVVCCKAYPKEIPNEVWEKKATSEEFKIAPCPNGYSFEPKSKGV